LFCPRRDYDDDSKYYDEDIANGQPNDDSAAETARNARIEEAEGRKWVALEALQILAYDGDEAAPGREWMLERLDTLMTKCDVCVRVFHQSRSEWRNKLVEQYEEEMVLDFLRTVDDNCLQRIQRGLDGANATLHEADPKDRGVGILDIDHTMALFEALSCDALIRNEDLLQRHFDVPFQLVQTRKRLKIQLYLPAMTRFLFSNNEQRRKWAMDSWRLSKRNVLKSEFDWVVRSHLVSAMFKVQMGNLDLPFVATYWQAVHLIVNKMDKDSITHSLRDLEGNFYRLLLDHLHLNSDGFLDLISSMRTLLEKSPTDFWDAMDAITPNTITVVEQVLNSPVLKKVLLAATAENKEVMGYLEEAFSWFMPFLTSLKPATLEPAVRAFAQALLGRFQADQFSAASRAYCFKEGLRVLDFAFRKMCEGKQAANFVGQPTVNKMLEVLSTHIEPIVASLKRLRDSEDQEAFRLALSMIQHAFTLEAHSLNVEKHLISSNKPSPTETPPSSPIWKAIIGAIDANNLDLAAHLLVAGRNLIGLEALSMKAGINKIPPTVRHFNSRFALLSQSITDVVDRLAEFDPNQLSSLFEQPPAASAIMSLLFSSTEETRNSSIELLKVISGKDERRDALQHILRNYYKNALVGISDSCRQVSRRRVFAAAPSMIRTCTDIIDVMCNSQDGILRSRTLDSGEPGVTMNYWRNLWSALTIFFETTEAWSNLGFYDKNMMMEFCRDVMQFADQLFDQCSIFATALKDTSKDEDDSGSRTAILKELLRMPADAMGETKKWLRLRDDFLSSKSVTLIKNILTRLHDVSIEIDPVSLQYMEDVLTGKVKAKLNTAQQAELQRALEIHLGHSLVKEEDEAVKQPRQVSLSGYVSTGAAKDTIKEAAARAKLIASGATTAANRFAEQRAAMKAKEQAAKSRPSRQEEAKKAQESEFMKKRRIEKERQEKEKQAAIARARQAKGLSAATAEAGSGLEGLGILGKDQAAKGEGLMHSSDESEDEGDFDEELFGIKGSSKAGPKTNIINEVKVQMPVKKRRVVRSVKDMRARLAPDLSPLHKVILGWDYFHNGDLPPGTQDNYTRVQASFRTPNEYQATFQPLLTLEAWQGFVKAREENREKPYEIRIVSRASVDAFQEVSSTMTHAENRDISLGEGDIVLLSRSDAPSAREPHCLARVFRVQRKQAHIEVSYRVMPGNSLQPALKPQNAVYGTKIQSITPLEREYGALLGLQYYDLCDEIIRAKPSPLLKYKDSQIAPLEENYNLNKAQAKAVKSAIDNDAFTLIQGYVCPGVRCEIVF
jgi:senataxin